MDIYDVAPWLRKIGPDVNTTPTGNGRGYTINARMAKVKARTRKANKVARKSRVYNARRGKK